MKYLVNHESHEIHISDHATVRCNIPLEKGDHWEYEDDLDALIEAEHASLCLWCFAALAKRGD